VERIAIMHSNGNRSGPGSRIFLAAENENGRRRKSLTGNVSLKGRQVKFNRVGHSYLGTP